MVLSSREHFEKIIDQFDHLRRILVVGDVGIDQYIFGEVERISPEAPVPVLRANRHEKKLGMAGNICNNLNSLGVHSDLISVIGDDASSEVLKGLLNDIEVGLDGVISEKALMTIRKERYLTSAQQICRVDYEPAAFNLSDSSFQGCYKNYENGLNSSDAVILQDYSKGLFTQQSIRRFIDMGREGKKIVAVDPGKGKPGSFYHGATLFKPNLYEAKELVRSFGYEDTNLGEICKVLIDKLDVQQLVITLGAEGMALYDRDSKDDLKIIPTLANEVFDVSGAGDTVISLLVASLLAGASLEEAGWVANCGAGVVVAKKGTATVNKKELLEFYQKLSTRQSS